VNSFDCSREVGLCDAKLTCKTLTRRREIPPSEKLHGECEQ